MLHFYQVTTTLISYILYSFLNAKAEDSPWAQFFEEDSTVDDDTYIKSIQENEIDDGLMTALLWKVYSEELWCLAKIFIIVVHSGIVIAVVVIIAHTIHERKMQPNQ